MYEQDDRPRMVTAGLKLEGSAVYLRKQMTDRMAAQPSLVDDSTWMQVYTSCIVAAELETIRELLARHLLRAVPERTGQP